MEAGTKQQTVPRRLKLLIVDDEPTVNQPSHSSSKSGATKYQAHEALEFISRQDLSYAKVRMLERIAEASKSRARGLTKSN
jgi:hypothetical protein